MSCADDELSHDANNSSICSLISRSHDSVSSAESIISGLESLSLDSLSLSSLNLDHDDSVSLSDGSISVCSLRWDDDSSDDSSTPASPHKTSQHNSSKGTSCGFQDIEDLQFLQGVTSQYRNDRWDHQRMDWLAHVRQLQHEGTFENE